MLAYLTTSTSNTMMLLFVLLHRHVDHSGGLPLVAQLLSQGLAQHQQHDGSKGSTAVNAGRPKKAIDNNSSGSSSGGSRSPLEQAAASAAGSATNTSHTARGVMFDVHSRRPYRRGLRMTNGTIVPFNKVCTRCIIVCLSSTCITI